jgi:uncharacterized protein YjbJ (UPF0337 family)
LDEVKGRVKEASATTDNDKLKNEGKTDRAAGKVKEVAGDVKDRSFRRRRREGKAPPRLITTVS